MPPAQDTPGPMISVIMANYNGAPYLAGAIRSVLDQTLDDLEIILVDDGSSDDSVKIATEIAREDSRLKVISGTRLGGPAPVRNLALEHARGDWIAIVDSDDLIRADRLETMLMAAEDHRADILIDDLAIFQNDGPCRVTTMFDGDLRFVPARIFESNYIKANRLYGKGTKLGYAKPIIRRSLLEAHKLRYDETMRIGEDYDLIVRLLAANARMVTIPEAMYFYRKHENSISHRLDSDSLKALEAAAIRAMQLPTPHAEVTAAHAARLKSIRRAITYDRLLRALKGWKLGQAIRLALSDLGVIPMLRMPLMHRIGRLLPNPFRKRHRGIEQELTALRTRYGA